MEKMEDKKNLFSDFADISFDDWYKQAIKEVGQEQRLFSDTYEGIKAKPIYYQYNTGFVDGKTFAEPGWLYIEEVEVWNETTANKEAIDALVGGADGILFIFRKEEVNVIELLKGIWIDNCIVSFKSSYKSIKWLKEYIEFYQDNFTTKENLKGWLSFNNELKGFSLGIYTQENVDLLRQLSLLTSAYPNFNLSEISNHDLKNAGLDIIHELTYTIARGVEIIETLRKAEFPQKKIFRTVVFSITVSMNLFFEISKLRALRTLWTKIGEAYGVRIDPSDIIIHARTSVWNKSILDRENNVIRNAAEAMSAVVGGSNYISIDDSFGENDIRTRKRISRNISHILKEESFLNKVSDPARGSYYVENITAEIISRCWEKFLEIESEGGYNKAIENRMIHSVVEKQKVDKRDDLDLRRTLVIGANIFPNLHERVTISNDLYTNADDRATGEIEKLRSEVETTFSIKKSKRPVVLILTSNQSLEKSSITFLKNVFSSIGFLVEMKTRQSTFESLDEFKKYSFSVWLFENEDAIEKERINMDAISKIHSIVLTSAQDLKVREFIFYPIEELALTGTLKQILTLIDKK